MKIDTQKTWNTYIEKSLPLISDILLKRGFTLNEVQPHILGERFLMKAITTISGEKLILIGKSKDGLEVVIKVSDNIDGKNELLHEQTCRELINKLPFAHSHFNSPREISFFTQAGFTFSIQEYIPQTSSFLERPVSEQFSFALSAFKDQELARATTGKHIKEIAKTFGIRKSDTYLTLFAGFSTSLEINNAPEEVQNNVKKAQSELTAKKERIEQYCGFLTHTDFVPHNFRIRDNELFLLDFSALRFGNKHEGWARFLNFMSLHNPVLESLLVTYVKDNRAPEEYESLHLMRLFRLGEIITYYTNLLPKSSESLLTLNTARVSFWNELLQTELDGKKISHEIIASYQKLRDELRSTEEKQRQVGLH